MEKIIIFEEIQPKHRWLLVFYRLRGFRIKYFRLADSLLNTPWLQEWIHNKTIEKVPFATRLHFMDGLSDTKAFHNLEEYYPGFFRDNSLFLNLKDLYASEHTELVLKNILMKKLTRFYYLQESLSRIRQEYKGCPRLYFVPVRSTVIYQMKNLDTLDYRYFSKQQAALRAEKFADQGVEFPLWVRLWEQIRNVSDKFGLLIKSLCLPVFLWLNSFGPKEPQRQFKYGFMVLSARQFENTTKPVDFLIDGKKIHSSEMVFIPYNHFETSQIQQLKSKDLNFVQNVNCGFCLTYLKKSLPFLGRIGTAIFRTDTDALWNSLALVFYYVKWSSLCDRLTFEHFITQNTDTVHQALARDIIFQLRGVRLWKYLDSAGFVNYFFPKEKFLHAKEILFVYMLADNMVSWSKDNTRAMQTTRSVVAQYYETGNLWSQFTVGVDKTAMMARLKERGWKAENPVIGIFDTTFQDHTACDIEDGEKFLLDIRQLSQDFPTSFILFKEKKSRQSLMSAGLKSLLGQLDQMPRAIMTGNHISPSEVIAVSDLVISFSFGSTALEALASVKKAFWHDPSGQFRGTYYDQVPGLVTHSYAELKSRVEELLYQVSDRDFQKYLDEQVKDVCCPYFDQKGVERFRDLLVNDLDGRNVHKGYHQAAEFPLTLANDGEGRGS